MAASHASSTVLFHQLSFTLAQMTDPDFKSSDFPIPPASRGRMKSLFLELVSTIGPFRLLDLPPELIVSILRLSTSSYVSLMAVSHSVQALVRTECVPETVILLGESAMSFYRCLKILPDVGKRVRKLWFIPSVSSAIVRLIAPTILNACNGLEKIATSPDVLMFICNDTAFNHIQLVDITLVEAVIPWGRLVGSSHGPTLLGQIQTLRIAGTAHQFTSFGGTTLTNLTSLSFSGLNLEWVEPYLTILPSLPALRSLIMTIPYWQWQKYGKHYLMQSLPSTYEQLHIIHCPLKWTELDAWKMTNNPGSSFCDIAMFEWERWLKNGSGATG